MIIFKERIYTTPLYFDKKKNNKMLGVATCGTVVKVPLNNAGIS